MDPVDQYPKNRVPEKKPVAPAALTPGAAFVPSDSSSVSATSLDQAQRRPNAPLIIDVRRPEAYLSDQRRISGASRQDPAAVDQWISALPPDRAIVVYCVHGHEVSQTVAARLRAAGHDARFLCGGIEHWQQLGLATSVCPDV